MKLLKNVFLLLFVCVCFGCAAAQIALEKKDLKVETKMSATIFLDLDKQKEKTVFVDIKNTSDKEIDIKPLILGKLQARGYKIVPTPVEAHYILQGNILYVGKADPSAIRASIHGGYGGSVLAGAAAGAMIGGSVTQRASGVGYGAGIGGLAAGAANLIAGALVKDVYYTVITDLMISEKSAYKVEQAVTSKLMQGTASNIEQKTQSTEERKKYQTRVVSSANKVNLEFEEALPIITENLAKSVAGIF